ncbi:hypothetical protein BJF92_01925 [Rhizobium rhizosphaerae]|uniref:Uncharacterized protein n=2 Tax=Xaviernesmea rhizosphaerae TaxID=1672749 RepID=A0A1Q9AKW9_9HYPH|nr:hypothetical protein BJF92_01925 [Xaviernesmea rhizosphaerae]
MMGRPSLVGACLAALALSGCSEDASGEVQGSRGNTPILQAPANGAAAGPGGKAGPSPRAETMPRGDLPEGEGFDFYVLALSWSPSWCQDNDPQARTAQCDSSGRGFVVHGLWPQNERGYPQFCDSAEPKRVPEALGRTLFDIMPPALGLIGHQWRKHGSCSGLDQKAYFETLRAARERVHLPDSLGPQATSRPSSAAALEEALIRANPGMTQAGIAVDCDKSRLEEVRICMTKDLAFRDCAEVDRKGCRAPALTMPAPR